jgi:ribosome maturation factor RimP
VNAALEVFVKSEVESLGYDLVRLRVGGTRSRPVLEVRIDRRDGTGVTLDDCVRVSRALSARLDAEQAASTIGEGWLERRYELQVSSPGDARRSAEQQEIEHKGDGRADHDGIR